MNIDVIIPTYNRANYLEQAIIPTALEFLLADDLKIISNQGGSLILMFSNIVKEFYATSSNSTLFS